MRSRIDLAEKVDNKDRRFGAALHYFPVMIVTGKRKQPALFTAAQIGEAMDRAGANPEDFPVPPPSMWRRFVSWLAG